MAKKKKAKKKKAQDKGVALQKRAINLFKRAGFITTPKEDSTKEKKIFVTPNKEKFRKADLLIEGTGTILVECKDDKNVDLTEEIDKLTNTNKRGNMNADALLIISIGKKISRKDIEYAKETENIKIFLWGELKLKYYEILTNILKEFSAPELLHSFSITVKSTSEDVNYPSLKINQKFCGKKSGGRHYEMYLFFMNVEYLLKYCYLLRRANLDPYAFQRLLIKTKIKNIGEYISDYGRIPSGIIVALPESVNFDSATIEKKENQWYRGNMVGRIGKLTFPKEISSICIIDGQHRVYGFINSTDKIRKSFEIPIIGIKGFNEKEMTDVFIEVNENSSKIDPNLLCDLLESTSNKKTIIKDPGLIAIYSVKKLDRYNQKNNPFKGKIKIYQTESLKKKPITLKGFSGYDLRRMVKEGGVLRKLNKKNSLEKYLDILINFFKEVKLVFKKEWEKPEDYIICTNRGITVFLKLLERIINFYDGKISKKKYNEIISILKEPSSLRKFKNWKNERLKGAYIGYGGWSKFEKDVLNQIKNKDNKFKKL